MHTVRVAGALWVIALAGCADVLGAEFDRAASDDSCDEPDALRCGGDRLVSICASGHWQRLFECDASEHCSGTPEAACIPNDITCEYAKGQTVCLGSARVGCDGSGDVVDVEDCLGPCDDGECTKVLQVSVGSSHSCALVSNGVRCWGRNFNGALGVVEGYESEIPRGPQSVGLHEPVVEIAAGDEFTCARTEAGRVWCWGMHIEEPSNVHSYEPREMPGLSDIAAIRAGGSGACAIDAERRVYCWGSNSSGQITSMVENTVPQPQLMPGLDGAHDLFMGDVDTCALFDHGTVACCGLHDHARLVSDPDSFNPELVAVPGVGPSKGAAVDEHQACVLGEEGTVSCWGQNILGGLCLGDTLDRSEPTLSLLSDSKAILVGYGTLSLTNSGRVECCGNACADPLVATVNATPVPILAGGVEAIDGSGSHVCAIVRGRVLCWGNNNSGEVSLGQWPASVQYPTPVW